MRIKLSIGCISDGLEVGGISFAHLNKEQKAEVKKRLCEWIEKQDEDLDEILAWLVERFCDEYEYGEPCPQCGDYVETFILEI